MSHLYCASRNLTRVHSSFNHPSGYYICRVCNAAWEISFRGNVCTRLTRNNQDALAKVPSAKTWGAKV